MASGTASDGWLGRNAKSARLPLAGVNPLPPNGLRSAELNGDAPDNMKTGVAAAAATRRAGPVGNVLGVKPSAAKTSAAAMSRRSILGGWLSCVVS